MSSNVFHKRLVITTIGIAIISFSILYISTLTPSKINLEMKAVKLNEAEIIAKANDLFIQSVNADGIWASRGYDIYFMSNNKNTFYKIDRVPVPLGLSYFANSSLARWLLNKNEILELMVRSNGDIIAFAGGYIFLKDALNSKFKIVSKMEHFGLFEGRGVMPQGYTTDADGNLYWGEYWSNPGRKQVKIWKSTNGGLSWNPVYIFPNGTIRHIHAVQYDPYFKAIFVATGDKNNECKIMYSTDGGSSFKIIGSGTQHWRAVSLIFDKNYVYWGTDGCDKEFPDVVILRWDRRTKTTEVLAKLDSFAFYSNLLNNSIYGITTDGTDGAARIWISNNGVDWIQCAKWERKRKMHNGTIRIKSSADYFIITNLNLRSYNNDMLFIKPNF